MTPLRFRPALNAAEVDAAYALEAAVFGPDAERAHARRRANDALEPARPENVVLGISNKRIMGLVRLMPRELSVGGRRLEAAGLTHVCIDPEFQGRGAGRLLMNAALAVASRRGYPLAVTIARRAVDGFYPRFGFLGLDAFSEMKLAVAARPELAKGLSLRRGLLDGQIGRYAGLYRAAYGLQNFSYLRSASWWKSLGKRLRLKHPGLSWTNVLRGRTVVGYLLHGKDGIWEAASTVKDSSSCLALAASPAFASSPDRVFKFAPGHPWTQAARRLNHVFLTRAAWDGGHLACVLNGAAAARALGSSIDSKLRQRLTRARSPEARRQALADCAASVDLRPVWGPLDEF